MARGRKEDPQAGSREYIAGIEQHRGRQRGCSQKQGHCG